MRLKANLILFAIAWATTTSAQFSSASQHTVWTVPEIKEWVSRNKLYGAWQGLLLYQGSDSIMHHFISRLADDWIWFCVPRQQIYLPQEHAYSRSSSAPFGYYYLAVSGSGFVKVKNY